MESEVKKDKSLPLLSVCIPAYNHEKYIIECLSEVVKIDVPKNIIIIDDGSTDKTPQIIKNFINNHKNENIEFIEKENSGLVSSLNIGLEKTQTEYLYIIASDDIPNPKGIKKAIEYLIKNPNIDFFIGGGENFFDNGKKTKIYTQKHYDFFNLPFKKRYEKIFLDYPSPMLLQSTIFRTNILKKIGGWDKSIVWDDYPIFVKLLRDKNIQFVFNPNIEIVLYRHHGANSYKNTFKQFNSEIDALSKLAPDILRNKAIGKRLSYYWGWSLFRFKIDFMFYFLKSTPYKSWFWMIYYLPKTLKDKLWT